MIAKKQEKPPERKIGSDLFEYLRRELMDQSEVIYSGISRKNWNGIVVEGIISLAEGAKDLEGSIGKMVESYSVKQLRDRGLLQPYKLLKITEGSPVGYVLFLGENPGIAIEIPGQLSGDYSRSSQLEYFGVDPSEVSGHEYDETLDA